MMEYFYSMDLYKYYGSTFCFYVSHYLPEMSIAAENLPLPRRHCHCGSSAMNISVI
jgi:hypothetical protein